MRRVLFLIALLIFVPSVCRGQFATPLDSSDVAGWKFTTFTDVDDSLKDGHQIYNKIDTTTAKIPTATLADSCTKQDTANSVTYTELRAELKNGAEIFNKIDTTTAKIPTCTLADSCTKQDTANAVTYTELRAEIKNGAEIYNKIDSTTAVIDSAVGAERADTTIAEFLHKEGGTMTGNITMADDGWIGGGSDKGRMVYKDETQDTVMFWDCHIRAQTIHATQLNSGFGVYAGNGLVVASGTVDLIGAFVSLPSDAVDASGEIINQIIVGNHVDSTDEAFVFSDAYRVTSEIGDSAYVSRKEMRGRPQERAFNIQNIDSDHDIKLWKTSVAITIDSVFGQCDGGTNVIGALDEYDWDNTDLVAVVNADWTFTTTYQAVGSFTNAGIAAKNHLKWHTTSVSGVVDFFDLTIWYHED